MPAIMKMVPAVVIADQIFSVRNKTAHQSAVEKRSEIRFCISLLLLSLMY